ncbi:MAG: hypothetical protein K6T83_04610 [Alicyclobacillus sp.]|nr:hypothetical protein [Alicyclobacillus sp.]
MPKTVLVVSYFAPPLINAESILVWKTLREMSSGFDVKVLTATLANSSRVDPHMTLPSNIQVYSTPTFKPTNPFFRKLTDKALGMVCDEEYLWASFGRLQSVNYDLIYSRSHPGASHIFAHKLKQQTKKPWIAQFSDPWSKNPYHTNHTRFRKASDTHWEEQVVHHADYLVFPTNEILDIYDQAYSSLNIRSKSTVLPHHYVPELYNRHNTHKPETGMPPTISFAYFGDFYGVRTPEPFIRALEHIARTTPTLLNKVKVNFYGNIESKFTDMVDNAPVTITRSRVTYFESLNLMTKSDVLLLIDAPSETGVNPFLASKLVDYLGAGKRILGITDEKGTSADILRKYGHYVVSPHDIQGIIAAVSECIATPQLPVEPPKEFTSNNVVGQLVALMNQLAYGDK